MLLCMNNHTLTVIVLVTLGIYLEFDDNSHHNGSQMMNFETFLEAYHIIPCNHL